MALTRKKVVDNSDHYVWDATIQKFTCCYCAKTFAKTSLNVNTKAAHLSTLEFAKKYKIALCTHAPIDAIEQNVEYLKSIKHLKAISQDRVNRIIQNTDCEISDLTTDIEIQSSQVILFYLIFLFLAMCDVLMEL